MKALLIDDHPLILSALQSVIEGLGTDYSVTGVGSAKAARAALMADSSFDLVLLDLQLGDADGFDLLAELRAAYPSLPVVVVSASDRQGDVVRAIDLGAMGFVPKRASNAALFEALRLVMSGGVYVPPTDMLSADAHAPYALETGTARQSGVLARSTQPPAYRITPRQNEVLALLLRGQSNKLIARELNVSVETVKDHVAAVLRALNVNTRTQAVLAVGQMASHGTLAPGVSRPPP
jgi:DNA-binding NarL/FixJ family response regulator